MTLTAVVAEMSALRYTPAGLPVMNVRLEHESVIRQQGQNRQVKASIKAVAFGADADSLSRQSLGSVWRFTGFLSSSSRPGIRSPQTVLQIQEFQPD